MTNNQLRVLLMAEAALSGNMVKSAAPDSIGDLVDAALPSPINYACSLDPVGRGRSWRDWSANKWHNVRTFGSDTLVGRLGRDFGRSIGQWLGATNADLSTDYKYSDVVQELNTAQEVAKLRADTKQLLRRARIMHRKKKRLADMTARAQRNPYI